MTYGLVTAAYIAASVLFILALGGLSNQEKAKRAIAVADLAASVSPILTQEGPDTSEDILRDNGVMFAFVDLALVVDLADVDGVGQEAVEVDLVER